MTDRHKDRVVIPRTGTEISRLGLGTAPLSGSVCLVSESDRQAGIKHALELGINYIDTAPLYGFGSGEKSIGKVIQNWNSDVTISTKAGRIIVEKNSKEGQAAFSSSAPSLSPFFGADENLMPIFDFSREGILRSVEESLERLKLDCLDICLIHDPDDRIEDAIKYSFPTLLELKRQGLIKSIGVGVNYVEIAARAVREMELDMILIAGRYSLLDQSAGEYLFEECFKKRIAISVAGVFNSGILARPKEKGTTFHYQPASSSILEKVRKLSELFGHFGVSLTEAALQYPLQNPAVSAVIAGCRSSKEIEDNIEDFNAQIPDAAWRALAESGLVDNYEVHLK